MMRLRLFRSCIRFRRNFFSKREVGDSSDQSRVKYLAAGMSFGIVAGGYVVAVLINYNQVKGGALTIYEDVKRQLSPSDIQRSSTTSTEVLEMEKNKSYIHRPALEDKITSILHREGPTKKYFIMYGPKGVGKSILIDKCVEGKKGVVKVLISSVFEKKDILQVLSTKLMGAGAAAINEEEMINALKNAKVEGRLPTLIFEIERGQGAEQKACVVSVRSLCKLFAGSSNCIIILSETNAVLVFGQDKRREEIILVPEMTRDEALEFVRTRRKGIDDESEKEMIRLFEMVGTNAATLEDFLNGSMSVDEFIADSMATAKHELARFPIKPILKALKEHPEGVPPAYFNNQEYKGIDMTNEVAVGDAMKIAQSNVVFFDMNEKVYKLNSHALEVALRSYEPIPRSLFLRFLYYH